MLKFLRNNYLYILILIPLNIISLGVIFISGISEKNLPLFLGVYFIIFLTFGLLIHLLRQKHKIEILELENRDLQTSKNSSLEYIDALWKSQKRLIQNEKLSSLNSLVSGVAHELNTPLGIALTSISFLEELLKSDKGLEIREESEPMLNLAIANIKKSITLVENFKEISGNGTDNDASPVRLHELIDFACCRISSEKTGDKNCNIIYDFPEELWVNLSQMTLSVILRNIIENAYDFAFDNKTDGIINISVEPNDSDLILKIKDNGKGISQNNLKKVFDPFYTTKRSSNHYGLGLAISYNLISRHYNGDISCESQEGLGTTFTVVVPDVIYQKAQLEPKLTNGVL